MPSEVIITIWTDSAVSPSSAADAAREAAAHMRRSSVASNVAVAAVDSRWVSDFELRFLRGEQLEDPAPDTFEADLAVYPGDAQVAEAEEWADRVREAVRAGDMTAVDAAALGVDVSEE